MASKASDSKKTKDNAIKTDNVERNKFKKSRSQDPDVLVKVLSKATDKGDIFLGNTDLLLESVNKELKAIAKDINSEFIIFYKNL